ncbi:RNA polymerase sigma factor [Filimonas effusa]|uniref:Sigma-70 family RNA polymerase sigma factor n=1 Tax=Filimonas effusa TaxID=2508721 RepID=A0A4Q1D9W2_9BACT|nr:sigma-70 family RNA polymerase sigma factor [Filimonas effusa]RXK85323.1 sigma-70 family RNA polymerase sigma factor [Filimonas effusa]
MIPHLFRQEYSRMTAVLSRHFGLQHIEIAEDIASDTFLKASEYWAVHGIPDNPTAWLYTVARNKAKDYLKRDQLFERQIKKTLQSSNITPGHEFDFTTSIIADSQLAMIFAVCNPANSPEAQVCLALQILCGFSVEEIANAFLAKTETIKKRLQRARTNLRNNNFEIHDLSEAQINTRHDTVLKTLYLLFNEGYFSKTHDTLIRKDLCSEAMRLALLLIENKLTNTPPANALLALFCYQSSRLDARTDHNGEAILFEEQDHSLWDQFLVNKGNTYLVAAFNKQELSKYHLEAAIAYWHTTAHDKKWQHILQLYNQLLIFEYSPATALNRTFVFAKVYGAQQAIPEAEKLALGNSSYYHGLMGYLYSGINPDTAIAHYRKAISLTGSVIEKKTLAARIALLTTNHHPGNQNQNHEHA